MGARIIGGDGASFAFLLASFLQRLLECYHNLPGLRETYPTATGGVFTSDLIETWIHYKRTAEIQPVALRPHPHEFELYYDI